MAPDTLRGRQSTTQVLALDERDGYPNEAHRRLNAEGIAAEYVPAALGGRLQSFAALWRHWRDIARHDFTAATTHGATFGGASPIWVGGSREQQQRAASIVLGGGSIALGFTERDHGADLLATETTATSAGDGFSVSGEKWLISNAVRATAVVVFARTSNAGGPRGFSFFLIEKERLDHRSWTALPRVKTHGIRGAEVGGIAFRDCLVPRDALVGTPGSGLEIALKSLQITRTLATAGAIGGAESALRLAVDSGAPLGDEVIADVFADAMVCECVALSAVRTLHVAPEQASLTSSVAKYFVPLTVAAGVEQLADAMGWRACVRDGPTAMFQKLRRDLPIASLFDGSAPVNLNAIALQLGQLSGTAGESALASASAILPVICRVDAPLPPFDAACLDLTSRGRNVMLDALPVVVIGDARRDSIGICQRALVRAVDEFRLMVRRTLGKGSQPARAMFDKSPELFELAHAYATLHAAACALAVWHFNRDRLGPFFAHGDWLVRGISRLLRTLDPSFGTVQEAPAAIAAEARRHQAFAISHQPLAIHSH